MKLKQTQDLTGIEFDRLKVIERVENDKYRHAQWRCKCKYGNEKIIIGSCLLNGSIKSCGCLGYETKINNGLKNKKFNEYNLNSEYGIGYTFKGEEFYFDLEDYELIAKYCWYIDEHGYVCTHINNKNQIKMHRLVTNAQENEDVDHIKHILYDNRKLKLRKVTQSQNNMNYDIRKDNTSGQRGVCWNKINEKWYVYIDKNKKRYHLGHYINIDEAIQVRKNAEEQLFGEFSYDNSMNYAGSD
jgi:hypothetical protein